MPVDTIPFLFYFYEKKITLLKLENLRNDKNDALCYANDLFAFFYGEKFEICQAIKKERRKN